MLKRPTELLVIAAVAATPMMGLAQGAPPSKEATAPTMPAMKQTGQSVEHIAEGKVNAIDAAAGRVNITHGPVASANWPGMTMSFRLADPRLAAGLKPGERVQF